MKFQQHCGGDLPPAIGGDLPFSPLGGDLNTPLPI